MRTAIVCSIMKDEPHEFVFRWANSAKDAAYLVILDTGSTNGCDEYARSLGITVHTKTFTPWRFDHARNHLLSLLPEGDFYVINLDMDEVLTEGWAQALSQVPLYVTRPRYKYVWSWNADGSEGLVYSGDKIHLRHGFFWKHPVHEVITPEVGEFQQFVDGLEIHHFPDNSKSRGQYLPLLKLSVEETPNDDRNVYYYARELYFNGLNDEAIDMFKRHLALPTAKWEPERAWSMRFLGKLLPHEKEKWFLRAVAEYPCRETWLDLALYYYGNQDWPSCYATSLKCLSYTQKPLLYFNEAEAWGSSPCDLAALSAYHLGMYDKAVEYGTLACEISPTDERLTSNLSFYTERAGSWLTDT